VAAATVSGAVLYYLSKHESKEHDNSFSRRRLLVKGLGTGLAIGTAGFAGHNLGDSYGQRAPEFEADEVAMSLGVRKEDLVSAFQKVMEWDEKQGRASGPIMKERSKHWQR
jgi:hypothetical protein